MNSTFPKGRACFALAYFPGALYNSDMSASEMTVQGLKEKKAGGDKIVALTAWDYFTGALAEAAGVDFVLVGDSLAMTVQGETDTLAVTLDEMIYHTRLAARACRSPLLITDLPFMSYQVDSEQALRSSGRVLKETKARGVKIEGGREMAETVARVTAAGIPVVGHIGLTPQAVHQLSGFKAQGKSVEAARRLARDAQALDEAGICALVLEYVPRELAAHISRIIGAPTLGIGAGDGCDGQIQVTADLLGLGAWVPKHAKVYTDLRSAAAAALVGYADEVRQGAFPREEQTISADEELRRTIEAGDL